MDVKADHRLIERKKDDSESDPENAAEESSDSDVLVVKRPPECGRPSRSFTALPEKLQGLCYTAQKWVADYTLFKNPLLGPVDILNLINDAWDWA